MNKKSFRHVLFCLLIGMMIFVSFSCATIKTSEKEVDPNFLGDFDAFYLGEVMCLSDTTFGNSKPLTIHLYFAPRTSNIEARFSSGMNKVCLIWTPAEREKLVLSIEEYAKLIASGEKLEKRKATKKNAFQNGNVYIYWGVGGYTRDTLATYFTNYEYLEENKPYFKIKVNATPYPEEEHVSSPNINLFFSPTQLENLIEVTDYDVIIEKIEALKTEAYSW